MKNHVFQPSKSLSTKTNSQIGLKVFAWIKLQHYKIVERCPFGKMKVGKMASGKCTRIIIVTEGLYRIVKITIRTM